MPLLIFAAISALVILTGLFFLTVFFGILWHFWPLFVILGLVWFFRAKKAQKQGRPFFGRTYVYWHGPGGSQGPGSSGRRPMRTIDVVQGEPIREALPPQE